jgi:hypothetical protein
MRIYAHICARPPRTGGYIGRERSLVRLEREPGAPLAGLRAVARVRGSLARDHAARR